MYIYTYYDEILDTEDLESSCKLSWLDSKECDLSRPSTDLSTSRSAIAFGNYHVADIFARARKSASLQAEAKRADLYSIWKGGQSR